VVGLALGYGAIRSLLPGSFLRLCQLRSLGAVPQGRRLGSLSSGRPDDISLGRIDEQIQVRGCHIETNEVVRTLNEHPTVLASAVVAWDGIGGDKYLVAYVVVSPESLPTAAALQNFLGQRLPGYMVPSTFVRLQSLPLTSNGKVDRTSLPVPNAINTITGSARIAFRTVVEQRLVGALTKLLGIDHVGVDENFLLLGGDSLLATQVMGQVREIFGVELPLHALFETPTVAELSAEIDRLLLERVQVMGKDETDRTLGGNAVSELSD
jgi:acyl carrier protein